MVMDQKDQGPQDDYDLSGCPTGDPDEWLRTLKLGVDGSEAELRLYARYVRALALLCECAPFVDDADYVDLIDEVLADACRHYPLEWGRDEDRRAIAVRWPASG